MQGSIAVLGEKLDACCDWIRLLSDKTLIDRCGGSLTGFSVDAPTHARTINFHDSLDLGCHLERGIEQTCAAIFNLVRLKKIYEEREREREREYIYISISLSLSIYIFTHTHTHIYAYIYIRIVYTHAYRQMQLDDFERRSVSPDAPCTLITLTDHAENCRTHLRWLTIRSWYRC